MPQSVVAARAEAVTALMAGFPRLLGSLTRKISAAPMKAGTEAYRNISRHTAKPCPGATEDGICASHPIKAPPAMSERAAPAIWAIEKTDIGTVSLSRGKTSAIKIGRAHV